MSDIFVIMKLSKAISVLSATALFVTICMITFTSCQKSNNIIQPKSGLSYMNSLPMFNKYELQKEVDKIKKKRSPEVVWCIGGTTGTECGRVFRWNGTSWDEPNAAARLCEISQGTYGSTWGLGGSHTSGGRRIFKWNGASWDEPNPLASLYEIAAFSPLIATGIGGNGNIYVTYNGGANWALYYSYPSGTELKEITMGGNSNFVYYIKDKHTVYEHQNMASPPEALLVSGIFDPLEQLTAYSESDNGVYSYSNSINDRLYKSEGVPPTPTVTYESFPYKRILDMGAVHENSVWAIGKYNKIYRSTDYGATWTEPNPAAGAYRITAGHGQ